MLVLLLPHLDCIALPHCQPIGASQGSAHIFRFATDIASCHSLWPWNNLEHAACCVPRACSGWGGLGTWGKEKAGPQGHRHQQPLPSRPFHIMHVNLASLEYNILHAWAPLHWGGGSKRVEQGW